uniref:Protein kinase domain-containing protein n=1 Tax=Panagrolaimus superbus TaxID=310955 RepID=A0A914YGS2_9BILA
MRKATNRRDIEAAVAASTRLPSTVSGYERIRVVGKGSFGSAILYRRKADDSLVVIKEINMHELSTAERQLALNEVSLLSSMDHPHIISYYDSFEEDGILMIEMEYADGGYFFLFILELQKYLHNIFDFHIRPFYRHKMT